MNSNIIAWLYDFSSSRTQQVRVGKTLSDRSQHQLDAPSPILFSLYVEDMTVSENHTIIKSANDAVILEFVSQKSSSLLQHKISRITTWRTQNGLLINGRKTKELVFCNQRDDPDPTSIMINNAAVERVEEYKHPRTTISLKLNFNTNTRNKIDKASKRPFIIIIITICHFPVDFRAYSRAYLRLLPLTLAYSRLLPLMLMHKYRRENDKSQNS